MLQHKLHDLPPRREGTWDLCRAKLRRITHCVVTEKVAINVIDKVTDTCTYIQVHTHMISLHLQPAYLSFAAHAYKTPALGRWPSFGECPPITPLSKGKVKNRTNHSIART